MLANTLASSLFRCPAAAVCIQVLEERVMSVRHALLAGAAAVLVLGTVQPATAASSLENAYMDALQAVARVQAERTPAVDRLERVSRERAAKQADVGRRQEEATAEVRRVVAGRQAELDAHLQKPPPANDALNAAVAELRSARQAVVEAERLLKQDKAALVEAQSASSVLKVNIERAKIRIDANREEIVREQARIKRIEEGDAGELDELAKRAVQEREEVAAILREFEPVYQAAQRTARIAVGMHLPGLYKAKQAIGQIKTNFCGAYTESARQHIDYALQGIESFLNDAKGMAGVLLDLASKAEPKEADATCSHNFAVTGITEARERIGERERKIAEDHRLIESASAQLSGATELLASAKDWIAERERQLQAAQLAADALERDQTARRATWEAEAKAARQEHERRANVLRDALAEAKYAYEAAAAPFRAEMDALPALKEEVDRVSALAAQLAEAEMKVSHAQALFLDELMRSDVERLIRVSARAQQRYGTSEICATMENNSSFALSSVTLALTAGGKPLPAGIDIRLRFSGTHSFYENKTLTDISVDWGTDLLKFQKTNKYSERVPYLMPGARTASACASLDEIFVGNNLRILENLGYGKGKLSVFGLRIASFALADGSVSADSRRATYLGPVKAEDHYRARLDAVKARAHQPVVVSASAADPAIVPAGAVTTENPAVLGRTETVKVQEALIAAGLLIGKADGSLGEKSKVAIRRWQASKGYSATGQLTAAQLVALTSGR